MTSGYGAFPVPIIEAEVEPEVLKDKIFAAIRNAILRGELRPGQKLVELDLIKSLGVSRAPLRDSFWLLEKQGYVRMIPNRGTFVVKFSLQEVSDVYATRAVLEAWAVALAMQRVRPKDLKELRVLFRGMERTATQGDLLANFKVDLEFHQKIWQLSGNHKLVEILNNVCPSLFTYLLIRYQGNPSAMRGGLSGHAEILRFLESGKDSATVEGLVRASINSLAQTTMKLIQE
jgi:DNA-binding GntR family transcriptional regulator